jgi:hypothetical protein
VKHIDELIDYLRGTAHSLAEGCVACGLSEDHLTDGERAYLNEHIICCELCGWWEEAGEVNDDQQCDQCAEDSK